MTDTEIAPATMLVEFSVPMEGPRTESAPKGVSRRPGDRETVPFNEAVRLISRGMAREVDADGNVMNVTTPETKRNEGPEHATARPPVERAVSVPAPAGGKRASK